MWSERSSGEDRERELDCEWEDDWGDEPVKGSTERPAGCHDQIIFGELTGVWSKARQLSVQEDRCQEESAQVQKVPGGPQRQEEHEREEGYDEGVESFDTFDGED